MDMDEEVLMLELNRSRRKNRNEKQGRGNNQFGGGPPLIEEPINQRRSNQELKKRDADFQERDIIRILMLYGQKQIHFDVWDDEKEKVIDTEEVNVVDYVVTEIVEDKIEFLNPLYKQLLDEFSAMLANEKIPTDQHFINNPNPEISSLAVNFFAQPHTISERWKEHNIVVQTEADKLKQSILSSMNILKQRKLEKMISELKSRLKSIEDFDEQMKVQEILKRYLDVYNKLCKESGTVVVK
jgi:DNA primase